ncbi:MtnX-like HAD-IB family phosphatase [Desulfurispora thermophila]|uniref:MtnX-like HAD-IB family phosphatase n=1 Tax=Desulfurispora thermophila TaxID=265470 RepID=UPI00037C3812|nr:MtnX-like HAD-IB family phosphatase [Desulfurispora thermophila]
MDWVIFSDFDGTITLEDTCNMLMHRFGSPRSWQFALAWERGEIDTRQCTDLIFQDMGLTEEKVVRVIAEARVDPHFAPFLAWCRDRNFPVYILSDGFDYIINALRQREGWPVQVFANNLSFSSGYRLDYPHHNAQCGRCGTCKSSLVQKLAGPGVKKIYIGDSTSDFCPVKHCDVVLAKGKLAAYCRENGIAHRAIRGFADVLDWLAEQEV